MRQAQIEPHKVTKPIQLLAAWLAGLVLIDALFLGAATHLGSTTIEGRLLVWAAILNVPLFLTAIFILQTRFRAELQEDAYYAEYLSKKTGTLVHVDPDSAKDAKAEKENGLSGEVSVDDGSGAASDDLAVDQQTSGNDWTKWKVALNVHHPKYAEITSELERANISVSEVFGTEKPPVRWVISVNPNLPSPHLVQLLQLLLPFGFQGFQRSFPVPEADEFEDVYIGSYGITSFTPFSPLIRRILELPDAAQRIKNHLPPPSW